MAVKARGCGYVLKKGLVAIHSPHHEVMAVADSVKKSSKIVLSVPKQPRLFDGFLLILTLCFIDAH